MVLRLLPTTFFRLGIICVLSWMATSTPGADDVPERSPTYRAEREIVASDSGQGQHYLAFPAALDLGEEILISYKRGRAHADDAGAVC